MRIVIVAATGFELSIAREKMLHQKLEGVSFLTTGVGLLATAVSLTQVAISSRPDLMIQAGICGAYDETLILGSTVAVKEEILGNEGVQENNEWKDIFDLKLEDENKPPFKKGKLVNDEMAKWNLLRLPEVTGITVNEISTNKQRIDQLKEKYSGKVESMEGAAFHYVCSKFEIPFIQLRTVSNYVGERDKSKWLMRAAIENLNDILLKCLDELNK